MQKVTSANLKQRMDKPFFDAVVASAGLTINYEQLNYVAMEGPGGAGEVKPLVGTPPLTRFVAKCPQLPDLDNQNGKLDLLQFSTYHYLVKAVRFCVVVDGVEIFGSATALRDHGFFKNGDEIQVTKGKFDGAAFIRMDQLAESAGRDNVPFHRFFARQLRDLPLVYEVLKTKGEVREISFLPENFSSLLHEDAFFENPTSVG